MRIANPQSSNRLGRFLTADCKYDETPNGLQYDETPNGLQYDETPNGLQYDETPNGINQ